MVDSHLGQGGRFPVRQYGLVVRERRKCCSGECYLRYVEGFVVTLAAAIAALELLGVVRRQGVESRLNYFSLKSKIFESLQTDVNVCSPFLWFGGTLVTFQLVW